MALLTADQQNTVRQLAAQRAAANGTTPELELWKYAQSIGMDASGIDEAMGWPVGTAQNWAVSNGVAPAPQGNFNPSGMLSTPAAPASTAPTTPATSTPATTTQTPATPAPSTTQNSTVADWYRSILGREPDAAGMTFWSDAINKNGIDAVKQSFTASAQKELVDSGQIQAPANIPKPPTWQDTFNEFNQAHQAQYGIGIDRQWNADADAAKAKQMLDEKYLASLKDYNTKYKTDIQPDQSVLGANAQPNTYTPKPKTGNSLFTKLAVTAASVLAAPVTGGASLWAGPALLGVSEAAKTGDIGQGILTGALSAAGAYGANGLISGAGNAASAASYKLTGDAIADAAALKELGYSGAAIDTMLGAGGPGTALAIGTTIQAAGGGDGGLLSTITNGWNSITNAANTAGGITGNQLLATGANILGGYLNQQAATDAAKTQADAQIRAAQIAADAAKFKPVGVKTNFGQSNFGYDANGNLTSAGYTLSPDLYQQQGSLRAAAPGMLQNFTNSQKYLQPMIDAASKAAEIGTSQAALGHGSLNLANDWRPDPAFVRKETAPLNGAAQSAMALGNQYLQTSPQQQAAKFLAEQQALLAPGRAQEMAALQAQMQAQGRGGLMVGGGVNGQMASNPQMQALYNARLQQDALLAAQATQGGMDYAKFGLDTAKAGGGMLQDVYSTQAAAYQPYSTAQQLGQNQANYGIGMTGAAGQMLRDVFSTQNAAYTPYQTAMQGAQYLEGLGQNAMDLGVGLGSKETAGRAMGGQMLSGGMTSAANTIGQQAQQGGSMWGNLLQGGAQAFENYNKPAGTTYDPSKYRVVPL